MRQIWRIKI